MPIFHARTQTNLPPLIAKLQCIVNGDEMQLQASLKVKNTEAEGNNRWCFLIEKSAIRIPVVNVISKVLMNV